MKSLVVNTQHPELGFLASELLSRGELSEYIRSPFFTTKEIEIVKRLEWISPKVSATVRRRQITESELSTATRRRGWGWEALLALAHYAPGVRSLPQSAEWAVGGRASHVSRGAAKNLAGADIVVANGGCALEVFKECKRVGLRTVLSYPTVSPTWMQELVAEERDRVPDFSDLLPQSDLRGTERSLEELELADHLLVGSSFAKSTLDPQSNQKAIICNYGGWPLPTLHPDRPDKTFNLVFAGQIGQLKGISYLLEAFALLRSDGFSLTLAGRPTGNIERAKKYFEGVKMTGFLSRRDLAQVFASADVFVMPTLAEGLGVAAIDAMGVGLPVVTTARGPNDAVRDGVEGVIVPVRDPRAIAEAIVGLRDDPERRAAMAIAARVRAAELTWPRYATQAADEVRRFWER